MSTAQKLVCPCLLAIVVFPLLSALTYTYVNVGNSAAATEVLSLPEIDLNQTADIKLAFLGVSSEYLNQTSLLNSLPRTWKQFDYSGLSGSDLVIPQGMAWDLNYSLFFSSFPQNISDSLASNSVILNNSVCYNATLLDNLLSELPQPAVPKRGYLLTFMHLPNATGYSWFCIRDPLGIDLNATEYVNGVPHAFWLPCPPNFGGMRRAFYYDLTGILDESPNMPTVTSTISNLIDKSLQDILPNLLGTTDPRWMEADLQTYRDYDIRILWLNGTGQQLPTETISNGLKDLMPWTNWTITVQSEPAEEDLNILVENRTMYFPSPQNYTLFSNGTSYEIITKRYVNWQWNEYDPLNYYLIRHVASYFNLTDLSDKSVIPIILLQLDNDTASLGAVSYFPDNVILAYYQGSQLLGLDGLGLQGVALTLEHEVGHWLSLAHHSAFANTVSRVVCRMLQSGETGAPPFCAFCKDARRRMSFISYYNQTIKLLSLNQTKAEALQGYLNDSLLLFYSWNYSEAMEKMASIYFGLDINPPSIISIVQTPAENEVYPENPVAVNASVTDDLSGVKSVILNYNADNRNWTALDMQNIEGNIWNATIPAFPDGTEVTYVIVARDNLNNVMTSQDTGYQNHYTVLDEFSSVLLALFMLTVVAIALTKRKSLLKPVSGTLGIRNRQV